MKFSYSETHGNTHRRHEGYSQKHMECCNSQSTFSRGQPGTLLKKKKRKYSSNHTAVGKISCKFRKSRMYWNGYLKYWSRCCEVQMHIKLDILKEKAEMKQTVHEAILLAIILIDKFVFKIKPFKI